MRWLALVAVLAACGKQRDRPIDKAAAHALFDEVAIDAPPGISDLTIDDRGVLWAIPERDRTVIEIRLAGTAATVTAHELVGIPSSIDTEALAWLGDGTFAIGLEGAATPIAGIASAKLEGDKVVVTDTHVFDASELPVAPTINHGIEAICGRAGDLLAAMETVGADPDGSRWAPLLRVTGTTTTRAKLHLTTSTGKISALSCTIDERGTAHVIAIARHYGVCRILSFDVARDATDVTPKVEYDLASLIGSGLNLEGIARLADGRLVLVNDNQGRSADGPTELLVFHR